MCLFLCTQTSFHFNVLSVYQEFTWIYVKYFDSPRAYKEAYFNTLCKINHSLGLMNPTGRRDVFFGFA